MLGPLLRRLATFGFRKGLQGGGRAWLAIGIVSWFVARAKDRGKDPPPLYQEVLGPGEAITVRIIDPPP